MEVSVDSTCASTLHVEECCGNGTKSGPLNLPHQAQLGGDSSAQSHGTATPLNMGKAERME